MFHLILFIVYLTTLPIALASNDETISAELTKRMRKEIIISQFDVLYRYVPGTIHENHWGMQVGCSSTSSTSADSSTPRWLEACLRVFQESKEVTETASSLH